MRILAIDQSLTSAAAVRIEEVEPGKLFVLSYDLFKPKSTGIHRLWAHYRWLENQIQYHPNLLAREQHHMRQFGNAAALQQLTALLDLRAYNSALMHPGGYAVIAPGSWKKYVAGKGNLAKDTNYMRLLLKAIDDCPLIEGIGFDIPNDDVADAICIGVTAYAARRLVTGDDVSVPKGYKEWPVKAANMFEHGKPGK